MTITVRMSLERETKNAVCYREIDLLGQAIYIVGSVKIGTFHIRKTALGDARPALITVTVEEEASP